MNKNEIISNVLDKLFTEESENYDWGVVYCTSHQFFEWTSNKLFGWIYTQFFEGEPNGIYTKISVHCSLNKDGSYKVHDDDHYVTFMKGGHFGSTLISCKASINDEVGKKIIEFANKVFEEWSSKMKSTQEDDGLSEEERENLKFLAGYFGLSA